MNRSNFFKSVVTLLAYPSIISEIDWDKKQQNNLPINNNKIAYDAPVWASSYHINRNVIYYYENRELKEIKVKVI